MGAFHSGPFSVPSYWTTFGLLPKSSKNTSREKNGQCFSVTSNRWFSGFSLVLLYTWLGNQGDLIHLSILLIPILFEPAHPLLIGSPGFQWHCLPFHKASTMLNYWGICQAQFTVVPDSREVFLPRLSAGHLGKIAASAPVSRDGLSHTLTLQPSSLPSCRVSVLGHP